MAVIEIVLLTQFMSSKLVQSSDQGPLYHYIQLLLMAGTFKLDPALDDLDDDDTSFSMNLVRGPEAFELSRR